MTAVAQILIVRGHIVFDKYKHCVLDDYKSGIYNIEPRFIPTNVKLAPLTSTIEALRILGEYDPTRWENIKNHFEELIEVAGPIRPLNIAPNHSYVDTCYFVDLDQRHRCLRIAECRSIGDSGRRFLDSFDLGDVINGDILEQYIFITGDRGLGDNARFLTETNSLLEEYDPLFKYLCGLITVDEVPTEQLHKYFSAIDDSSILFTIAMSIDIRCILPEKMTV